MAFANSFTLVCGMGLAAGIGSVCFVLGRKFAIYEKRSTIAHDQGDQETQNSTSSSLKDPFFERNSVVNTRIADLKPVIAPAILLEEMPSDPVYDTVLQTRVAISNILNGIDDRLLVVVGPCSIHDPAAAIEYASKLVRHADELREDLVVVMRVYFEKPRTTVGSAGRALPRWTRPWGKASGRSPPGLCVARLTHEGLGRGHRSVGGRWKGLVNDPDLDGSSNINKGLRVGRQLLLDINRLGLPCGCEFLDTIIPQYTADLVSWGAIGARTTESQVHRQLASGLSMPVGFKNATHGDVQVAVDAMQAAGHPHSFLSVSFQGMAAIVSTTGNPLTHLILRGGAAGPNYFEPDVAAALAALRKAQVCERVVVDCSHGNSRKVYENQVVAAAEVGRQVGEGQRGLAGLMLESNLLAGAQPLRRPRELVYGQSITDACIDLSTTYQVLQQLAQSVRLRRAASGLLAPRPC